MMRVLLSGVAVGLVVLLAGVTARAQESAENVFHSLFGEKLKQVTETPQKTDDVARAEQIVAAARNVESQPALFALLCEKAFELAQAAPEGQAVALEAMRYLAEKLPETKEACQEKAIALQQGAYNRSSGYGRMAAARDLIDALLAAADTKAESGKIDEAVTLAQRAYGFTGSLTAADRESVQGKLKSILSRREMAAKIAVLERRLKADASDRTARESLIMLYVVELDSPQEAAKLLTVDCDARLRTYVSLAVRDPKDVAEAACLELGEWYRSCAGGVGDAGKPPMLRRARTYYERYLSLHKPPEGQSPEQDLSAVKARLALEQVVKDLLRLGVALPAGDQGADGAAKAAVRKMSKKIVDFAAARAMLPADRQLEVTLEMLRSVNKSEHIHHINRQGRNPAIEDGKLTTLNFAGGAYWGKESGSKVYANQELRDIDPLHGLGLTWLALTGCSNLKGDLSALAGMPLKHLDLSGCSSLESLNGLQGLPLETLILPSSPHIKDLAALRGMETLKSLTISYMGITSLEGLQGTGLTALIIHGSSIRSLKGIQGLRLKTLHLNECRSLASLDGIQGMPLETLSLSGWRIPGGSLAQLDQMGLSKLTMLNVHECDLQNLHGLRGLGLKELNLSECRSLRGDLSALKGMGLKRLSVYLCGELRSLNGIQGMELEALTLVGSGITSLKPLAGQKFSSLDVSWCRNLQSLDGLEGMPLEKLSARSCESLRDITALSRTRLTELSLDRCGSLSSLSGIQNLPLVKVSVVGCGKLTNTSYLLLARIPTLTQVFTGDRKRDERILQMAAQSR